MGTTAWEKYQIALTPQPARPVVAPRPRPAARPLASRSARLMARLIDFFVSGLPLAAAFLLAQREAEGPATTTVRLGIWFFVAPALLITQVALLSAYGQTLGKLALGIRIVDDSDGSNPGFLRAVVCRSLLPGLLTAIPILGTLFALLDVLAIFGEDRRCLHDVFADTRVVEC
jgi:uncharacterized RDD family membrane protein YckC